MIPILYEKNASDFGNNGIGHLKDTISCKVTEERNGAYTLNLQYPIAGAWYRSITEGSIIKAKVNETSELQLFRVYKSSKPMKGVVTFYAEHISYDLKGLPLLQFSVKDTTAEAALNAGFAASLLPHRFTVRSDISSLGTINITKPRSLRNFCGGEAGSVLSVWKGEFEFDNFVVRLHKQRGADNGVVINYGKNLTDAKQERNISACYTHFCPYAVKRTETTNELGEVIESTEETITLPEGMIELIDPENIGHLKALTLDISDKFEYDEDFITENLRKHAEEYIKSHKLGVPDVNITLSFMQIWDSPEYAGIAGFERVALCDTVTVYFENLGINAVAKVIKTEYDSLAERFTKIEIGDAKSSLTDTISGIKESINDTQKSLTESEKAASEALQNAIARATDRITGNSGGHVVLYPPNYPQEILIMDSPDKETALRVWRWNSSGLGYSSKGYNGPFGLAMTMDGEIVADYITTGTLNAINILGCTIKGGSLDINDNFKVDSDGNAYIEGEIVATSGIIGGCRIIDGALEVPTANITGQLTADQIDAKDLKVDAANITGQLTADQINAKDLKVDAANITGQLTADQIDAKDLKVDAANITGQLTADQIDATDLAVKKANITSGDIGGFYIDHNSLYSNEIFKNSGIILSSTGTESTFTVNGTSRSGWKILAGYEGQAAKNFGIDGNGNLFATGADISGKITADRGDIGGLEIADDGLIFKEGSEGHYKETHFLNNEILFARGIGSKFYIRENERGAPYGLELYAQVGSGDAGSSLSMLQEGSAGEGILGGRWTISVNGSYAPVDLVSWMQAMYEAFSGLQEFVDKTSGYLNDVAMITCPKPSCMIDETLHV